MQSSSLRREESRCACVASRMTGGVKLVDPYRRYRNRNPSRQVTSSIRSVFSSRIGHVAKLWRYGARAGDFATTRRSYGRSRPGASSVVGRGSVFAVELTLPECHERVAQPVPAMNASSAPIGLAAARGKTVLLVEDNAVNAFISAASLESMGVASVHASDGNQAVDLFRHRRFDAVLMDCEMPVMDGFAATRLIREFEASSGRPRTPIIALTANALTGDREHCLRHGMDDYLSKPIELRSAWVARREMAWRRVGSERARLADTDIEATRARGPLSAVASECNVKASAYVVVACAASFPSRVLNSTSPYDRLLPWRRTRAIDGDRCRRPSPPAAKNSPAAAPSSSA